MNCERYIFSLNQKNTKCLRRTIFKTITQQNQYSTFCSSRTCIIMPLSYSLRVLSECFSLFPLLFLTLLIVSLKMKLKVSLKDSKLAFSAFRIASLSQTSLMVFLAAYRSLSFCMFKIPISMRLLCLILIDSSNLLFQLMRLLILFQLPGIEFSFFSSYMFSCFIMSMCLFIRSMFFSYRS